MHHYLLTGAGWSGPQEPLLVIEAPSIEAAASDLGCQGISDGVRFRITGRDDNRLSLRVATATRESGRHAHASLIKDKLGSVQQMYLQPIPAIRQF